MRILLLTAALVAAANQPSLAKTTGSISRAEALYRSAVLDLGRNTIDTRRRAITSLEQATILDPANPSYELLLARAYYQCGFLQLSKQRFERIEKLLPADADGHFGLGLAWRRDWLKYLERKSLIHAIDEFRAAGNLQPTMTDAWLELVPLLVERDDLAGASDAADKAFAADPKRPEALLARAECAYRRGDVRLADSLFRAAVPRLPRLARERFDDISPVATERDTFALHRLPPAAQREFVSRFWRDNDPDLSSVENEAMLEYWSRVAQAYFLYFDAHRREWDERGEVYVRYGPPTAVSYNPVGMRLSYQFGVDVRGGSVVSMGTGPPYPMNALVWSYPELGMDVVMQDRMLSEYYLLPITRDFDPDPVPNPAALERQPDRLAVSGGRGVFRTLPPGIIPMTIHGQVARFMTDHGPRLLANVEAAGTPADTMRAEWTVLDTARREVARQASDLLPSACDPGEFRVADFAADLPPGRYLVGLTVRTGSRRGVYRSEIEVGAQAQALAISDVVVTCGTPGPEAAAPPLRMMPNPEARIGPTDPLTAYFEIYHLSPDSVGQSRFEYMCTVRSIERDPRIWVQRMFSPRPHPADMSATRQDEVTGTIRRQFVSVPVQSLPPGHYQLEVRVRDLVAGGASTATTQFIKLPAFGFRD